MSPAANPDIVIDTHVLIWYLLDPARLSTTATAALQNAEAALATVYVSAITLVELRYLIEKGTFTEAGYQAALAKFNDPFNVLKVATLDWVTADTMAQIPRATVPDMPDRIIAATALTFNLPLITRDTKIRRLTNITTIW